jgi:hypothetical protein
MGTLTDSDTPYVALPAEGRQGPGVLVLHAWWA